MKAHAIPVGEGVVDDTNVVTGTGAVEATNPAAAAAAAVGGTAAPGRIVVVTGATRAAGGAASKVICLASGLRQDSHVREQISPLMKQDAS